MIRSIISINILSSTIQKLFELIYLGWLNKLLGSLIGFLKGLIVISIIIFCMDVLPEKTIKKMKAESTIYKVGSNLKDMIFSGINYDMQNAIDLNKISKEIENTFIDLDSLIKND